MSAVSVIYLQDIDNCLWACGPSCSSCVCYETPVFNNQHIFQFKAVEYVVQGSKVNTYMTLPIFVEQFKQIWHAEFSFEI